MKTDPAPLEHRHAAAADLLTDAVAELLLAVARARAKRQDEVAPEASAPKRRGPGAPRAQKRAAAPAE